MYVTYLCCVRVLAQALLIQVCGPELGCSVDMPWVPLLSVPLFHQLILRFPSCRDPRGPQ